MALFCNPVSEDMTYAGILGPGRASKKTPKKGYSAKSGTPGERENASIKVDTRYTATL
jgi:hypothetical protein